MINPKRKSWFARTQRGQGMVEFALVIPFLLALLLGITEFGFFFFVYSSVNSAAREAVRYGSAVGPSAVGVPYFQYCQGIREAAKRVGVYSGLADSQIAIGYDSGPGTNQSWTQCLPGTVASSWEPNPGDRLIVRVSVAYNPIVSMLGVPPVQVQAQSARTILRALEIEATPLASPTDEGGGGSLPTATEEGGSGTSTPTEEGSEPTPTRTPTRTPTPTATCKFNNPKQCEAPPVCMTPLELGGCE